MLDHPRAVAVGEIGLDYYRDYAPRDAQRRLFERLLAVADGDGQAGRRPHPRRGRGHARRARRLRRHGRPALLLLGRPAPGCARARLLRLVRRQRDLPEGVRPAASPPPRSRPTGSSPRRTRRTWRRSPSAAGTNEPAYVVHTLAALAEARGETRPSSRRRSRRTRPPPSACVRDEAEHKGDSGADGLGARRCRDAEGVSITPRKELGQHFLVDENILGVIGRLAELDPGDVVLEIGPGLGVLTRYLAERVALVHAVEIDRSLEPHLPRASERPDRARRRAPRSTSPSLDPPPGKLVSNLPYNVATPIVVESLDGLPVGRELVRDGAARGRRPLLRRPRDEGLRRGLRPRPARGRANGLPPGLAHGLPAAARTSTRRSSPSGAGSCPSGSPTVKRVVEAAFAHRRKTLPNSLELAGLAEPRRGRRGARAARASRRHARRGARAGGVRRARAAARVSERLAHAKINLALVVGPVRADGKHEVTTVLQRIGLADRIAARAGRRGSPSRASTDDTLVRRCARAARGRGRGRAGAGASVIDKQIPVAAGLGGGSSDAAAALLLANETLDRPLAPERLHELAAALGADVPFFLAEGPQLGEGDGTVLTGLELPQRVHGARARPGRRDRRPRPATSTRRSTRGTARVGYEERRAALLAALAAGDLAALPPNDLASSPLADELRGSAPSAPTSAAPVRPSTGCSHDASAAEAAAAPDRASRAGSGSCRKRGRLRA